MVAKAGRDKIKHILGDRIRRKRERTRIADILGCSFTVVMIEIPLALGRFSIFHQ